VPPVDLVRLVEWLNENQHSIQAKNHLRNPKNLFNVTHGTQLSEMKRIMKSDRYFLRAQQKQGHGASGAETGFDSYAMDQGSSGLGATGHLFQSRGNSQLLTQTQAFNMKQPSALRDFGAMSHMSESADELASQQDGMAQSNPYYDDPNSVNLPKLINNQGQRGGSQLLQKPTDPRDFQSSQYSQQNRSQMSHGGMPVNQTYIDLMIHDGIQKQNMQMNSQITKTINIIRKDPKLLHQVQSHLQVYQEDRIKKSYEDGVNATNIAKMRVREQVRLTNEEEE
jgi:hypothetical protein